MNLRVIFLLHATVWATLGSSTPSYSTPLHPQSSPNKAPIKMAVGFNHVPPDSMVIDDEPRGPAILFLEKIAKAMGIHEVEFTNMPLPRIVHGISNNLIDCVPRIGGKGYPDSFVYADAPFSFSYPGLLVRKELKLDSINSGSDLKGMTIGTKLQMPLTKSLEQADVDMQWVGAQNPLENAIRMLTVGRVDAVYSPSLAELIIMAGDLKLMDAIKPLRLPDEPWPIYVAFSKEGAKKFKTNYDKTHETMLKSGAYQKLYDEFVTELFKRKQIDLVYLNLLRPNTKL